MVLAVLSRRAQLPLASMDTYLSTVGGVRLSEPASDLAIALAVASAHTDLALPPRTIAFGEVGLAGEVRPVTGPHRRLAEAARLGFETAFVPPRVIGAGPVPEGIRVVEVPDVQSVVSRAFRSRPRVDGH
jgi:DNA repair protein RadA/Sms